MTAPFNIFEAPFLDARDWTRTTNNELGIYAIETTQRAIPGQRRITLDGRVFKYGFAKTALLGGYGAANYFPVNKHIACTTLPVAITAGDVNCTVTFGSTIGYANTGFAKDELAGGYIVVGHGSEATVQNRLILGNDVMSATGATAKIYVSAPFSNSLTTSASAEVYPNPYAYLGKGALEYNAFMGVAAMNTTILNYGWIQTWGPCWVVPGGGDTTPGNTVNDRTAFFVGDGSVNFGTALTVETGYQVAGFCIDTTSSAVSAMPLIMLQISI
jgi:hypothetical protein